MSSLVLLRWVVPADAQTVSDLIRTRIAPSVRACGWLSSPGTSHHVSDDGRAACVTVVTSVDRAPDVADDLTELLGLAPSVETAHHVLLAPEADWYRTALQHVTHVSFEVLEAREAIPLSEWEAFADPSEAAPRLTPFLNEVSDTYRRTCSSYEPTERFWLDFFRRGPTPELARSGELLWNLAG